jgi:magnesium-transporting ATPase (P-type)
VLLLGVSLAVAAVPEGLPAILSVVLALGVQRLARRHAIVKQLASVETLGSASVIATDKTGTLTRAEMTIVRVVTASGTSEVTGVGYGPRGQVQRAGVALVSGEALAEVQAVLSGGSLAGNATWQQAASGAWQIQGDPTEAAFLVAEHKLGATEGRKARFTRLAELPFTSDRKMMSTLEADHAHGDSPVVVTKGAPGEVLARCTHQRVGHATVVLDATMRQRILAEVAALADEHSGGGLPCAGRWRAARRAPRAGAAPGLCRYGGHHRPAACRGGPGHPPGAGRRPAGDHDHGRPPAHGAAHRSRPRHASGGCRSASGCVDRP